MPTGRYHLHDALQSHRLPFWFGLAGSISGTVRRGRWSELLLCLPPYFWIGVQALWLAYGLPLPLFGEQRVECIQHRCLVASELGLLALVVELCDFHAATSRDALQPLRCFQAALALAIFPIDSTAPTDTLSRFPW